MLCNEIKWRPIIDLSEVYMRLLVQVVGWLLALAGVGAAAKIELNNAPDHIHRGIGIAIEIMVGIQV